MKKRFIAGAVCPQCGLQDKVFVYQQEGEDIRQCNACGFMEERPKEVTPMASNTPSESESEGVVKIMERAAAPKPQDKDY